MEHTTLTYTPDNTDRGAWQALSIWGIFIVLLLMSSGRCKPIKFHPSINSSPRQRHCISSEFSSSSTSLPSAATLPSFNTIM
jgi:hypothetical protein